MENVKRRASFRFSLLACACRIACLCFLCTWTNLLQAQPNFAGGKGDGYAMVRLGVETSVVQAPWAQDIRIWPNPATAAEVLFIEFPTELSGEAVELIAADGRVIAKAKLPFRADRFKWKLPDLPAGLYLLRFLHPSGTFTRKLQLLVP